MVLRAKPLELAPEDQDDEVVVSRKKLDQLLKEKDAEIARLREEAKKKDKEIEERKKQIEDLHRQLAVHLNPNVPPSVKNQAPGHTRSHPLTPPEKRKKPGQKRGHEGLTREPVPPDEQVIHTAQRCGKCQSPRLKLTGQEKTTETEWPPPPKPRTIEHTQNLYQCQDCGAETRATMPDGQEPSEWGPRLRTEVVLGKILDRLPYRKLRARLVRQGGDRLWMSTATLQGIVWKASEKLAGEETAIVQRLRASPHIHIDESIFRVDGHREWLWVFVTSEDVFLVIRPSRNRELEEASLRARVRRLNHGNKVLTRLLKRYGESADPAVMKVITYLRNGMPWWLTFLGTPGMEATNNRGERGLREAIVIRKIIGTLRNQAGATAFTRLLSVLGTWSLRGEDLSAKLYGALSRPG